VVPFSLPAFMTRRTWLALSAAASLRAQNLPYPGVSYRNYARCLPDYLKAIATATYQRRLGAVQNLTNPAAIAARQRWARLTFWELIGGELPKTPLNPRSTSVLQRDGYRIEKVIYDSRPGFPITANLYVPTSGPGPFPAVLLQMGHSPLGKAYATYQRCAQGLAQLGFVVLGFDPQGQGERVYYPDSTGKASRFPSADDEHSIAGWQMLLTGDTATRLQTWDAVRSLDYLLSLPYVDPRHVATTGQSGGATDSMFLLAVDDRITCAVLTSANSENFACKDFSAPGSTDDAEQNLLSAAPANFDRWDTLCPFAPKPLLLTVSDKDFLGTYSPQYIASGWEEYQHLKAIYSTLGKADHLAWGGTALPHSLEYDTRLQVYNWFLRWMKPGSTPITEEPPTRVETPETLQCTERGNVIASLRSETPFSLQRKNRPPRKPVGLDLLLQMEGAASGPFTVFKSMPGRGVTIEAVEVPSAPAVFIPAWLYTPRPTPGKQPVVILLQNAGRRVGWHEDELHQTLTRQGFAVCVPDLRGVGDLLPEIGPGNPRYVRSHNEEEAYAWASLMLGRSLLGQRVVDLLAVVRGLKQHPAHRDRPIAVAAQGQFTVVAQCAAAIAPEISRLYLSGGLVSFASVAATELYNHPFANFVPGFLNATDLPEITAFLGDRRLVLAGMLDGAARPMDAAEVRRTYPGLPNLEVVPQTAWTAEAIGKFAQL
jgi:cephalosporin-C deacetylase-like acetyl esterase